MYLPRLSRASVSGQPMSGSVLFAKDELARRVDSVALHYTPEPRRAPAAAAAAAAAAAVAVAAAAAPRGKPADYKDALKDFSTTWLAKLGMHYFMNISPVTGLPIFDGEGSRSCLSCTVIMMSLSG